MKSPLLAFLRTNQQFVLYCIIGASGAALDFLVYSGLVRWAGGHYQMANLAGYTSGTALSFVLNVRFNFKTNDRLPLRLACFFAVAALGCSASACILHLTVGILRWNKYAAKLLTMVAAVLIQYNLNRVISFRKGPKAEVGVLEVSVRETAE